MQSRMAPQRSALWLALAVLLAAAVAGGLRWWLKPPEKVPSGAMLLERADRASVAYLAGPEAD